MNIVEAARLLTISSSFTGREPTEEQAVAWATVLDDIPLDEALVALRSHYRASRFPVMPSDIVEHVEEARRAARKSALQAQARQRQRAQNAEHRRSIAASGRVLRDDDYVWPEVGWTGDSQEGSESTSVPASIIASRSA